MIRLQLLGALGLTGDDGQEVRPLLAQPKRLAVFLYLLLAEPRGFVRRDSLVALFWPELSGEAARAALRRALHFLRSHLGDTVIVSRGEEEVSVAAERVSADALDFESHLSTGREVEALALYHGDLLAGFFVAEASPELEDWIERQRRRYREAALQAALKLGDKETAAGSHTTARFWVERALALAPHSEPTLVRLLRLLEQAGERAAALEAYEQFARTLQRDVGVEPGPELRGLVQELRARRPTPVASPGSGVAAPSTRPAAPAPYPLAPPRTPARSWHLPTAAAAMLAVLVLIWRVWPHGDRGPTVLAVGAVSSTGGADSAGVAATLPELLVTGLGSLRDVQVISRARLYEVSGESGEHGPTAAALLRAAKRAGAQRLVEGEAYPQANGWRLDLRLVDLDRGSVDGSYVLSARDPFALADSATARLAAVLRRPAPVTHAPAYSPTSLVARRYFDDGLRAFARRDFSSADALFGLALGEDSAFALALFYEARTRDALSSPRPETMALFRRAYDASRNGSRYERLLIATAWAAANEWPRALPLSDSLLAEFPYEPEAYVFAAQQHEHAADYAGQLSIYRRLAALDSSSLAAGSPWCRACLALEGEAGAYSNMDSVAQSLAIVQRLAAAHPDSRTAFLAEVWDFSLLGQEGEAQRRLAALADSVGVRGAELVWYRAGMALRRGDFIAVDHDISSLLSLSADDRLTGLWLQVTAARMRGRLGAAQATARLWEAQAGHSPATAAVGTPRLMRAITAFESGQPQRSAAVFDSMRLFWIPTDTGSGFPARMQAWMLAHEVTALAAAGDTARLAQLLDTLQRLGQLSGYARDQRMHHYARGLLWDARGRPAEAVTEFRQALTSPVYGYTRINYRLAADLVALGRAREAIPLLQSALHGGTDASNLYITYTELHEQLGRAFEAAGQRDSATAHYRWVAEAWRGGDPPFAARGRVAATKAGLRT